MEEGDGSQEKDTGRSEDVRLSGDELGGSGNATHLQHQAAGWRCYDLKHGKHRKNFDSYLTLKLSASCPSPKLVAKIWLPQVIEHRQPLRPLPTFSTPPSPAKEAASIPQSYNSCDK